MGKVTHLEEHRIDPEWDYSSESIEFPPESGAVDAHDLMAGIRARFPGAIENLPESELMQLVAYVSGYQYDNRRHAGPSSHGALPCSIEWQLKFNESYDVSDADNVAFLDGFMDNAAHDVGEEG